jgi:hypothetical protein
MNTKSEIETLLVAISVVVAANGSWQSKYKAIMDEATSEEKVYLEEFASWFEEFKEPS